MKRRVLNTFSRCHSARRLSTSTVVHTQDLFTSPVPLLTKNAQKTLYKEKEGGLPRRLHTMLASDLAQLIEVLVYSHLGLYAVS